jgi:hypothetical protein
LSGSTKAPLHFRVIVEDVDDFPISSTLRQQVLNLLQRFFEDGFKYTILRSSSAESAGPTLSHLLQRCCSRSAFTFAVIAPSSPSGPCNSPAGHGAATLARSG